MKRVFVFATFSVVLTVAGLFWEKTWQQLIMNAQIQKKGTTLDKIFNVKEGMSYSEVKDTLEKEGQLLTSNGQRGSINYIEVTFQGGKAFSMRWFK